MSPSDLFWIGGPALLDWGHSVQHGWFYVPTRGRV